MSCDSDAMCASGPLSYFNIPTWRKLLLWNHFNFSFFGPLFRFLKKTFSHVEEWCKLVICKFVIELKYISLPRSCILCETRLTTVAATTHYTAQKRLGRAARKNGHKKEKIPFPYFTFVRCVFRWNMVFWLVAAGHNFHFVLHRHIDTHAEKKDIPSISKLLASLFLLERGKPKREKNKTLLLARFPIHSLMNASNVKPFCSSFFTPDYYLSSLFSCHHFLILELYKHSLK